MPQAWQANGQMSTARKIACSTMPSYSALHTRALLHAGQETLGPAHVFVTNSLRNFEGCRGLEYRLEYRRSSAQNGATFYRSEVRGNPINPVSWLPIRRVGVPLRYCILIRGQIPDVADSRLSASTVTITYSSSGTPERPWQRGALANSAQRSGGYGWKARCKS